MRVFGKYLLARDTVFGYKGIKNPANISILSLKKIIRHFAGNRSKNSLS